jgi:hypothetical protein
MNDRVPDSTGLPLRAMVMVLLFLGVIFLLVGFQAMGSGSNTDDDSSVSSVTTSAAASKTSASAKPAPKADVLVFNISSSRGVAGKAADQIKQGGFNVTKIDNLTLPDVSKTTVYFTDAPGEHETADAVGQLLKAVVAPRTKEVADQPPGVLVVVTG